MQDELDVSLETEIKQFAKQQSLKIPKLYSEFVERKKRPKTGPF